MSNKKLIYLVIIALCFLSSTFGRRSMEFTSAKTYARVEKNLEKASEFGLLALEKEPDNAYIPYFLAREVFMLQKKIDLAAEMFVEALNRPDTKIERAFKIGDTWYRTVHESITIFCADYYNYGVTEINNQNPDKAIEYFNYALKFNADHIETIIMLSEVYYNKNEIDKSLEYINLAITKVDDPKDIVMLKSVKSTYLRKAQRYDEALSLLLSIQSDLDLFGKIELFMLFIEMGRNDDAIDTGSSLILEMEDTLPLDQGQRISDTAYNLAICYREEGEKYYNEIIQYITNTNIEKNIDTNLKYLDICELSIENFSLAKEYFEISYDYDENSSQIIKEYRKEMKKLIKTINNELIPALEQ